MTETAPSCAFTTGPRVMAGFIGYPAPGCEIKLVPYGDKLEFCVRGLHVMKGYWRLKPDQQSTIFDEDGFSVPAMRYVWSIQTTLHRA